MLPPANNNEALAAAERYQAERLGLLDPMMRFQLSGLSASELHSHAHTHAHNHAHAHTHLHLHPTDSIAAAAAAAMSQGPLDPLIR